MDDEIKSIGINTNSEGKYKYSFVNRFSDDAADPDAMLFDAQQHGLEKCNDGE